jgi:hypothetical protein
MKLEPFSWWCLKYLIIPFAAAGVVVFVVHQILLLFWDLRDQRLERKRRRELYNHLHRNLQERLRRPSRPPADRP